MSSPNSAEISGSPSPAPSSIGNNAPKYGTLVPNRIFVGGISGSTTEQDLLELFSQYGAVKATKIISDRAGVSKGYGFVTFETEDEARRLTQEADNIMLKDRKLNIAPAIKKQVSDVGYMKTYSPRLVESNSSMIGPTGTVFFGNGATYTTYGNSVPVIGPAEYHPSFSQAPAAAAAAAAAPPPAPSAYQTIVYQQPMYYAAQQYQYQPTQTLQTQWGTAPQWRWVTPASYPQPECNSQCLVEPSSIAQREDPTISVGNTPITSSSPSSEVLMPAPSPSMSSNATTTTTTSSFSTTTTTTASSSSSTSATAVPSTLCDSPLSEKPFTDSSKNFMLTNSEEKAFTTDVEKALDSNNNSSQDSQKTASTSPSNTTQSSQSSMSSDSGVLTPDSASKLPSSKATAMTSDGSTVITSQASTKENANVDNSQSQVPFHPYVIETPVEALRDCDLFVSVDPELLSTADPACNSTNDLQTVESLDSNSSSQETSSSCGHPYGFQPPLTHTSSCPHFSGDGVVAGPKSAYPHQVMSSPVVLIPSWVPLGKQGATSSPVFDLTSKLVAGKVNNHTERSQVSPPSPAVQSQLGSHSTVSTSLSSPEMPKASQSPCVVMSVNGITTCVIDGKSSTSFTTTCITTTTATLVSATSTVASNSQSICSPTTSHSACYSWQPNNSCAPMFPGSLAAPSLYRYTNQGVWVIVPSYPYPRTGVPCYQWPTPTPTHWPIPLSPSHYASSSLNSIRPSYGGISAPSSMLRESVSGPSGYPNVPPVDHHKPKEEMAASFERSKHYEKRGNFNHRGDYNYADGKAPLRFPPTMSTSRMKGNDYSWYKKSKGQRMPKPVSHQSFRTSNGPVSSSCTKAYSCAPRNPGPLRATSQPASSLKSANVVTRVDDQRSPRKFEDSCGLMPMTPPPTPVLKSDSSANIASDTSMY